MSDQSIASRIKGNKRNYNSVNNESKNVVSKEKNKPKKLNKSRNEKSINIGFESKLNINELNDYALESILSRLALVDKMRSQMVCKRWHQLINVLLRQQTAIGMKNIAYHRSDCAIDCRHSVPNEDLIDRAIFEFNTEEINEFDLRNAIQRNANKCFNNLDSILSKCPKLLALDLRSIELNESLVELIGKRNPRLECLHLNSMVISDEVWLELANRLGHRLVHLTIRNSIQPKQQLIVETFIRSCGQLKCLKVTEWNESLKFNWFDCIPGSVHEIHIACTSARSVFNSIDSKKSQNIKRFKLSTFEALTQSVIDTIGHNFQNLTQINLRNCEGFSKRSYRPIAQLTQLKHLTMDLPFANCDEDFEILAQNCTKMRSIELNFGLFTLNCLQLIGKHWQQLESISFRFVTIERLNFEALDVLCSWKHLRRLSLHGTNITDDICQLIECSNTLRYLNLDLCNFISKGVVHSMIAFAKRNRKELFELSVKETKINKLKTFKGFNVVSNGLIRFNNLYVYYTTEEV